MFNLVKPEEVAFWLSMGSVVAMCTLFLTEEVKVIYEGRFFTLTPAGLFGLNAAFFYGLHALLKGRPGSGISSHLLFSLFMLVFCLILFIVASSSFEVVTSVFALIMHNFILPQDFLFEIWILKRRI